MSKIVRIIEDGDEQVVPLSEDCWFDVDEVEIWREGASVVLAPPDYSKAR